MATAIDMAMVKLAKCKYLALCPVVLFILALSFFLWSQIFNNHYVPELPSITLKSMSMTALTNIFNKQVKVNLEIVFDPVENKNKHNTIIYDHVYVKAFDVKNEMFSNTTFEQHEHDKTTVVIRLDGVTVKVSVVEDEDGDYSPKPKYGVSFLDNFEVAGLVRIEGGKWVVKSTTSMRAKCGTAFKRVFPLYQLNRTHTLDLQPTICEVDGDWSSFILKCKNLAVVFLIISYLLVVVIICSILDRDLDLNN
ncbi:hypothetical protein FNV43_RR01098 [Rhamnella rubrinervis]|uniref:Uncharacterized protein n=1 Tax=Rhamnella rubrinervis TaxID=2594499 RepID=A0A8K0HRV9_9ROSA|nr:hypothetical protein FNV43_RR01098 [Rhamnella rubrinervis]